MLIKYLIPASLRPKLARQIMRAREKRAAIGRYPELQKPINQLRLAFDREHDNFTYTISNTSELAQFISQSLNVSEQDCARYIAEIENDSALQNELSKRQNRTAHFGRRVGWYAITRLLKPRVIVEAGVHDGLGATAFLAALERNANEGFEGKLIGMDIRPEPASAWLIPPRLRSRFEFVAGDIKETLLPLMARESIDIFMHDSDHSEEFERWEYEVLKPFMPSLLLSDAAGYASESAPCPLEEFANENGQLYHFWHEAPVHYFYPGAGLGIVDFR